MKGWPDSLGKPHICACGKRSLSYLGWGIFACFRAKCGYITKWSPKAGKHLCLRDSRDRTQPEE